MKTYHDAKWLLVLGIVMNAIPEECDDSSLEACISCLHLKRTALQRYNQYYSSRRSYMLNLVWALDVHFPTDKAQPIEEALKKRGCVSLREIADILYDILPPLPSSPS